MKDLLIELLHMRFIERTKHNEIFENKTHVLVWNPVTCVAKIKPK
jgi:hypothetical protein